MNKKKTTDCITADMYEPILTLLSSESVGGDLKRFKVLFPPQRTKPKRVLDLPLCIKQARLPKSFAKTSGFPRGFIRGCDRPIGMRRDRSDFKASICFSSARKCAPCFRRRRGQTSKLIGKGSLSVEEVKWNLPAVRKTRFAFQCRFDFGKMVFGSFPTANFSFEGLPRF